MATRRTTLAAESDDLAQLEHEAARRGVSLAQVLREVVAREAMALRTARRPRFGVGESVAGAAFLAAADEDAPLRSRPAR